MTAPAAVALPDRARVVVIGGGIIGTSVAYHLAHLGFGEVLLLERDRLTSGTTWHAAGLMATFGSTSQTSTELRKYTWDLYSRLEAETGLATPTRRRPGDEIRSLTAARSWCSRMPSRRKAPVRGRPRTCGWRRRCSWFRCCPAGCGQPRA